MKNHIFTTSEKAWNAMLVDMTGAKKSIYMEMYIFDNDTSKHDFSSILEDKARAGLKVILVLDIFGSIRLDSSAISRLRSAGVEVLFYSFLFRRAHRKVLIVDDSIAFVGGVNISSHFTFWKDLQIRVTGRILKKIIGSFALVYKQCGGKDDTLKNIEYIPTIRKTRLWFVERGMGKKQQLLRKYYVQHIDAAKKSIVVVTPYLFPPRWLIAHFHQAILRGVSVEILLPDATDYRVANMLNHSYASFFTGLGAKCFFASGMNHGKAMLIDDNSGIIGSQNLDILSFEWNAEAGVFFDEPNIVKELANIINDWKKGSSLLESKGRTLHWYHYVITFLLRIFGFLPLW